MLSPVEGPPQILQMSRLEMVNTPRQYGHPRCRMAHDVHGTKWAVGTANIDRLLAAGWKIMPGTGVNLPPQYVMPEPVTIEPTVTNDPPVEYKRRGRPKGSKNKATP